jgi:hypothetical protein
MSGNHGFFIFERYFKAGAIPQFCTLIFCTGVDYWGGL